MPDIMGSTTPWVSAQASAASSALPSRDGAVWHEEL